MLQDAFSGRFFSSPSIYTNENVQLLQLVSRTCRTAFLFLLLRFDKVEFQYLPFVIPIIYRHIADFNKMYESEGLSCTTQQSNMENL
jgi:hypothetical protein